MARKKAAQAPYEPSFRELMGRYSRHALHLAWILGIHWGIKLFARHADLEQEWWVSWLENGTAGLAVAEVILIGGVELIGRLRAAARSALGSPYPSPGDRVPRRERHPEPPGRS
jgi:hypothetical protein